MFKFACFVLIVLALVLPVIAAPVADAVSVDILESTTSSIRLNFTLNDQKCEEFLSDPSQLDLPSINGLGSVTAGGMPKLPAVSRWIIIPEGKSLKVGGVTSRSERLVDSPFIFSSGEDSRQNDEINPEGLFPLETVVISQPVRLRQHRLARLTFYPLQYDAVSGKYIERSDTDIELRFVEDTGSKPAGRSFDRIPSPDFQRLVESIAVNPPPHRDHLELIRARGYFEYYLFVMPDHIEGEEREAIEALVYRLMEWKRQAGNKVDLLWIPDGNERDPGAIKAQIQDYYDYLLEQGVEPFDNVLLIGEDEWQAQLNNQGGQGEDIRFVSPNGPFDFGEWTEHWDLFYGYLEHDGDEEDYIADVALSRFHTGNAAMLANGVNKTLSYQSEPYMEDPSWFNEAVVEEEAILNAGFTVRYTVDYFIQALQHNGMDVVAQFRRGQGNSGAWLAQQVSDRIGFIAGRAQNDGLAYHQGGMQPGFFDAVGVFPIAILNSGHGEWAMESLFWVGRDYYYDNPDQYNNSSGAKGVVAATCTWSIPTTTPNNCLGVSMVHSMLDLELSFGWSRVWTTLNLARSFPFDGPVAQDTILIKYSNDFQLCGDPGIRQWNGIPRRIRVEHPQELAQLATHLPVQVTDEDSGIPLSGIMVTVYKGTIDEVEHFELLLTDAEGRCEFRIDPGIEGDILITALSQDIYPYKGSVQRVEQDLSVVAELTAIDDSELGNNNGEVNAGESLSLVFSARNAGGMDVANVVGTLRSGSLYIQVSQNNCDFGDIPAGEISAEQCEVEVLVLPDCPDGERLLLVMDLTGENGAWGSAFELDPRAPRFSISGLPEAGLIDTGEDSLDLELVNSGRFASQPLTARLESGRWEIRVIESEVDYDVIEPGHAGIGERAFQVDAAADAIPGTRVPMRLVLFYGEDTIDTLDFILQVGTAGGGDPSGPDPYGYYALDDTDEDWDLRPEYDWIEISPFNGDAELTGIPVSITRGDIINGWGVVELPFNFRFYGEDFRWITVSTNGYIAMGADQYAVPNPQNWSLDDGGAGGAYGMIAPFWDNLSRRGNASGIFTAYDNDNHSFIIQWENVRFQMLDLRLTFQVMLYDPAFRQTASTDGVIQFTYTDIEQNRGTGLDSPYATVGISSPDGTMGLTYSMANIEDITAAPLEDQRSILFTTSPQWLSGTLRGTVRDAGTGRVLSGAVVITKHGSSAMTDGEGRWVIEDVIAEVNTEVTVYRAGYYRKSVSDVLVPRGENLDLEIELEPAAVSFRPGTIRAWLEPDAGFTGVMAIDNQGLGSVDWIAAKRLQDVELPLPGTVRLLFNPRLNSGAVATYGIAFVEERFFIPGTNAGGQHEIFVFDDEGNFDESFTQPGGGVESFTDLAWDGSAFWGGRAGTVLSFSTVGDSLTSFETRFNAIRSITWDADRQFLWLAPGGEFIYACDREGREIRNLYVNGFDVIGLAYHPDAIDGYSLYVYHRIQTGISDILVCHRIDPDAGTIISGVPVVLEMYGDFTGGACISGDWDPASWVFMSHIDQAQSSFVHVVQLGDRVQWFNLERYAGSVGPGEVSRLETVFDATDLDTGQYFAELQFMHNASDQPVILPVEMRVIGAHQPLNFRLHHPIDSSYTDTTSIFFNWFSSRDPNEGEEVSYIMWIRKDPDSTNVVLADTALTLELRDLFEFRIPQSFTWWVKAASAGDTVECNRRYTVTIDPTVGLSESPELPIEFCLEPVFPNPFNAQATVRYALPAPEHVRLSVFDIRGREVALLVDGKFAAGHHSADWNAAGYASGVYFCRIQAGDFVGIRKVILIR